MKIGKQVKTDLFYRINHDIGTYINLDTSLVYEQGYLRINVVVWVLINTISQKYENR